MLEESQQTIQRSILLPKEASLHTTQGSTSTTYVDIFGSILQSHLANMVQEYTEEELLSQSQDAPAQIGEQSQALPEQVKTQSEARL